MFQAPLFIPLNRHCSGSQTAAGNSFVVPLEAVLGIQPKPSNRYGIGGLRGFRCFDKNRHIGNDVAVVFNDNISYFQAGLRGCAAGLDLENVRAA